MRRRCVATGELERCLDSAAFAQLLRQCRAVEEVRLLDDQICKSGYGSDGRLGNLLVQMYGRCGDVQAAKDAFDSLAERNVYSWTALVAANAWNGKNREALHLFRGMEQEGVKPSEVTLVSLLSACCSEGLVREGVAFHCRAKACGLDADIGVQNSLVTLYGKLGTVEEARRIFDRMAERDVVSWNAMVAAYARKGYYREALQLFKEMNQQEQKPTVVSFVNALTACAGLGELAECRELHSQAAAHGLLGPRVNNSLMNAYGRCEGGLCYAKQVFDGCHQRDTISFNCLLAAYLNHGHCSEVVKLYHQMDVQPNEVTFLTLLSAISDLHSLDEGRSAHCRVSDTGYMSSLSVCNSLINMYGKCGSIGEARAVFDQMPHRNVLIWTTMLVAYVQMGHTQQALGLFHRMDLEGMKPREETLVAVLGACRDLKQGEVLRTRAAESQLESEVTIGTALVNMYSKHGSLEAAKLVFRGIASKDVPCWTRMVAAYTRHGKYYDAVLAFREMLLEGMKPDHITLVTVLEACGSSLPLARFFHCLVRESGCELRVNVATALVNAYSKCRCLNEAKSVFWKTSQRDAVSWNAIIGACAQNGAAREALGIFALMDLEGQQPDQVTLLNVLEACSILGELNHTVTIHRCAGFCELDTDVTVANTLVNTYRKCGQLDTARVVFDEIQGKDVYSWSTMVGAYAHQARGTEALDLYERMLLEGMKPDPITFMSVLFAASHTGQVSNACRYFVSMVSDHGINPLVGHYVCMVDVLCRCGWLNQAEDLVNSMPFKADDISLTSLLGGSKLNADIELGARAAELLFKLESGQSSAYLSLVSTMYPR